MSGSIPYNLTLPLSYDLYCDLFLKSEDAGIDFDFYVTLVLGIRALGLFK